MQHLSLCCPCVRFNCTAAWVIFGSLDVLCFEVRMEEREVYFGIWVSMHQNAEASVRFGSSLITITARLIWRRDSISEAALLRCLLLGHSVRRPCVCPLRGVLLACSAGMHLSGEADSVQVGSGSSVSSALLSIMLKLVSGACKIFHFVLTKLLILSVYGQQKIILAVYYATPNYINKC